MKKSIILSIFLLTAGIVVSQGVAINEDGTAPDPSAVLDLTSTDKGVLIPRMTLEQRDAIVSPQHGLLIYQTNSASGFYYNGGIPSSPSWQQIGGASGQWQVTGQDIYRVDGNVGIGEENPSGKLHISEPGEWAGVTFTGSGLNDLSADISAYNGTGTKNFAVRIQNAGPDPNLIQISSSGGTTWSAPMAIAPNINMGFGVYLNFDNTTGHTFDDRWDWTVNQSFSDVLVVSDGKVGVVSSNPRQQLSVGSYLDLYSGTKNSPARPSIRGSSVNNMIISPAETGILYFNQDGGTGETRFMKGNSTDELMRITQDGNMGIGTNVPAALLHLDQFGEGGGNVLFEGEYRTGLLAGDPPASGASVRFMWYPNRAALRAGEVDGLHWDADSIGDHSVALGYNTKALGSRCTALGTGTTAYGFGGTAMGVSTTAGSNSTAMGRGTNATGDYSTAMGFETNASGQYSTSMGYQTIASGSGSTATGYGTTASGYISFSGGENTTASGDYSTAMGRNTTASGAYSIAMGYDLTAPSAYEFVIGIDNTSYTASNPTGWDENDRLFVIGYDETTGNAMTILKSGRIGLHSVVNPTYALELPNSTLDGLGRARANAWNTYSDKRIKSNLRSIPYGLNEILELNPLAYFQHHSTTINNKLVIEPEGANSIGFIAQEVFPLIPEAVTKPEDETNQLWGMSYEKLIPVLTKAIQEQQVIIEELRSRLEKLEKGQ